eukprot:183000-Rhodomonas_salina.1
MSGSGWCPALTRGAVLRVSRSRRPRRSETGTGAAFSDRCVFSLGAVSYAVKAVGQCQDVGQCRDGGRWLGAGQHLPHHTRSLRVHMGSLRAYQHQDARERGIIQTRTAHHVVQTGVPVTVVGSVKCGDHIGPRAGSEMGAVTLLGRGPVIGIALGDKPVTSLSPSSSFSLCLLPLPSPSAFSLSLLLLFPLPHLPALLPSFSLLPSPFSPSSSSLLSLHHTPPAKKLTRKKTHPPPILPLLHPGTDCVRLQRQEAEAGVVKVLCFAGLNAVSAGGGGPEYGALLDQ